MLFISRTTDFARLRDRRQEQKHSLLQHSAFFDRRFLQKTRI